MVSPCNAVILAYLSASEKKRGFSVNEVKSKLEKYSKFMQHNVIKRFEKEGPGEWWEDEEIVDEVADFVEHTKTPVTFICYVNPNPTYSPPCNERWNKLIRDKKVQPVSYRHPCFIEPTGNVKIWRYISLAKFTDLLQSQMLYFSRADRLRSFDKREGELFTKAYQRSADAVSQLLSAAPERISDFEITNPDICIKKIQDNIAINAALQTINEKRFLKNTFINCWHMSESESFAMWKIYADNFGVCVQSTYERLCNSYIDDNWRIISSSKRIYIGEVLYINREESVIPLDNGFWPYMHKGREFSYEKELRCIVSDISGNSLSEPVKIAVNLGELIENIFVSPFAPSWFSEVVKNLCQAYSVDPKLIHQSSLE